MPEALAATVRLRCRRPCLFSEGDAKSGFALIGLLVDVRLRVWGFVCVCVVGMCVRHLVCDLFRLLREVLPGRHPKPESTIPNKPLSPKPLKLDSTLIQSPS